MLTVESMNNVLGGVKWGRAGYGTGWMAEPTDAKSVRELVRFSCALSERKYHKSMPGSVCRRIERFPVRDHFGTHLLISLTFCQIGPPGKYGCLQAHGTKFETDATCKSRVSTGHLPCRSTEIHMNRMGQ
jgi:hypothetical protein